MKTEKIGEMNFQGFKTEFKVTKKIKEFFENEGISLASLIPDAWLWYEVDLFEILDEDNDGEPDKKFGKEFVAIFYEIINFKDSKNKTFIKKLFKENLGKLEEREIDSGEQKFHNTTKTKTFDIKYLVVKK